MTRFRIVTCGLALLAVLGIARPALADLTLFAGSTGGPARRAAFGGSLGLGLTIVGVEFEYSATRENADKGAPALTSGAFNLLLQTPQISGFQFYWTGGAGIHRERLLDDSDTGFGTNIGGGLKLALAGPARIRFDYRVFRLGDGALESTAHRVYAGLNLSF